MSYLTKLLSVLPGYRKLSLALLGLFTLQFFAIVAVILFIVNWKLGTSMLTGDNLKDILIALFTYDAAIIASYSGTNVVSKAVDKWTKKKTKE